MIGKSKVLTVALVGLDGAGKTTIARMLLQSSGRQMRYLYMGTAIGSSNFALPSSRLLHYLKERRFRGSRPDGSRALRPLRRRDNLGPVGAVIRLLHRSCEEWFRQAVSWLFQLRGLDVIYDRHFLFECAPNNIEDQGDRRFSDRVHFWLLRKAYPKPDMVFFLDAPPAVLFERKPEATIEYLSTRRKAYMELGVCLPNFVRIDATQSPAAVVAEIQGHMRLMRSVDTFGEGPGTPARGTAADGRGNTKD